MSLLHRIVEDEVPLQDRDFYDALKQRLSTFLNISSIEHRIPRHAPQRGVGYRVECQGGVRVSITDYKPHNEGDPNMVYVRVYINGEDLETTLTNNSQITVRPIDDMIEMIAKDINYLLMLMIDEITEDATNNYRGSHHDMKDAGPVAKEIFRKSMKTNVHRHNQWLTAIHKALK